MSQASPTSDEGLRAIYHYAVRRMAAGASGATLQRELVEKGLAPESAETVVTELTRTRYAARRQVALRNIGVGGLVCAAGVAATIFTFAYASQGSGRYIIAYGPAIFGGIQFCRGLFQLMTL